MLDIGVNAMQWKNCNEWMPTDGFILEDAAMIVATSNTNKLVMAGPGSGKTELLAQRASFLLETNSCIYPQKILAISFKKDAALNLKDRVEKRCGKELVSRFDSMTFDAFAKSLLDRFMNGLPINIKPNKDYDIGQNSENNGVSILSFLTISKLATEIIRTNPMIKKSLQLTYSHIFLDEFQDTTSIQYDLIKACFLDSKAVFTAVGDSKQRIMLWAGARKTVFDDYLGDFKATKEVLLMNHRSAPRLVEIQKAMYANLNEKETDIKPSSKWDNQMGESYLRFFDDEYTETDVLCNEITDLIKNGIKPSDICILVKQTVDAYSENIIKRLEISGIKARNETVYQDLLKEEIVKVLASIFMLTVPKSNPIAWRYINNFFCEIESLDENSKAEEFVRIENELNELIMTFSKNIDDITDEEIFNQNIDIILDKLSYDRLAAMFPEFKNKAFYLKIIADFKKLLWMEYLVSNDWKVAVENFMGENSISIMTIHKSKGLEYHSVFFIGLEDSAFWNFKKQPDEDKCTFFVALSRAKVRVDFTFCSSRKTRFTDTQSNEKINELYEMLAKTGLVKEIYH